VTTIDVTLPRASGPTAEQRRAQAALAEERYLASVRRRVGWQAGRAEQLRAAERAPELDVLDVAALRRLVDAHPEAPRAAEWRAFLAELAELADTRGRLPEVLERLVRVVLAELL
jgi:hypothetical protein